MTLQHPVNALNYKNGNKKANLCCTCSALTHVGCNKHPQQHKGGVWGVVATVVRRNQSSSGQRGTTDPETCSVLQLFKRLLIKKLVLYPRPHTTTSESRKGQKCLFLVEHARIFSVHSTNFVVGVTAVTFMRPSPTVFSLEKEIHTQKGNSSYISNLLLNSRKGSKASISP